MSADPVRRRIIQGIAAGGLSLALPSWAKTRHQEFDAVIIGAGLSGLSCALQLEMLGFRVGMVEARDRVGGRVWTLGQMGAVTDAGGQIVAGDYARFKGWAKQLNVPLEPLDTLDMSSVMSIGGSLIKGSEWATSKANKLPEARKKTLPMALISSFIDGDNVLTSRTDWTDSRHQSLDQTSLKDFLISRGADEEALRLMNISPNTNDLATTSALWAIREHYRRKHGGRDPGTGKLELLRASGGNSRLPDAMAKAVQGTIMLNTRVKAIRCDDHGGVVHCTDGRTLKGKVVISTLPYSVLRSIRIDPKPEGILQMAIDTMPYTAITQLHFHIQRPFWEEDGLPISMWTDSLIERVFVNRDEHRVPRNITVWIDGAQAQQFDKMPPAQQVRSVIDDLARIRPSTKGALRYELTRSWGRDPFNRGAYSHFAPGQCIPFAANQSRAMGRLFFAGEHTSIVFAGMEGALESADRVVGEVIDVL